MDVLPSGLEFRDGISYLLRFTFWNSEGVLKTRVSNVVNHFVSLNERHKTLKTSYSLELDVICSSVHRQMFVRRRDTCH